MSRVDDVLASALSRALSASSPQGALKILDDARAGEASLDAAAVFHNARANVLVALGKFDDAVAAADRAVDLEPGIPDLATNLGAALLHRFRKSGDRADLERARRALQAAVDLGPRTSEVRATLAVVFEQLGEPARALAVCDENLQQFPGDAATSFNRVAALKALGRIDEAKQALTVLAATFAPAREALARWR